ncbi:MAG TPA: formyltransferase family protein [Rhizomicrobium sp.]|nr:formyltransferase family protein [Rhizomicrobium sp.]
MRILFIGAVLFSRRALEQVIAAGAQVAGVCTLAQSVFNADHCDLSSVAQAHDIPWLHADDINAAATLEWIRAQRPDIIFCFGWSKLLKSDLLNLAPMGVVGFHPAALPANRGRHPIIWALALGLTRTASTFFFMDEGADSGDILSQRPVTIGDSDDAAALYEKVTQTALAQIAEFLPQLIAGHYPRVKQDHSLANAWRRRGAADGKVDWRMPARGIHNLVRALARPYVGAHFVASGAEIKLWRAELVTGLPANLEPGKVVAWAGGPVVKCGEDAIRLLETAPDFAPAPGSYL